MILIVVKAGAMVFMFTLISVVGLLPLRGTLFDSNERLLSLTASFSGGLFLSVGLLHLLPEAQTQILNHYADDPKPHFPIVFLLLILSFSVLLWIEKVAYNLQTSHPDLEGATTHPLTPFFLQGAIGIHAVFEGLAIGIQKDVSLCLGITFAVVCHKWAEGLTLGLSFKQARIDLQVSTAMILLQALMNPIGVGIGWILSTQGDLVTSIFQAISAGTFLYIATLEVLVHEFSTVRHIGAKYALYLVSIGFVSSIWYLEQITGG